MTSNLFETLLGCSSIPCGRAWKAACHGGDSVTALGTDAWFAAAIDDSTQFTVKGWEALQAEEKLRIVPGDFRVQGSRHRHQGCLC